MAKKYSKYLFTFVCPWIYSSYNLQTKIAGELKFSARDKSAYTRVSEYSISVWNTVNHLSHEFGAFVLLVRFEIP